LNAPKAHTQPKGKARGTTQTKQNRNGTDHTSNIPIPPLITPPLLLLHLLRINLPHDPSKPFHRPLARKYAPAKLVPQPALAQQNLDPAEVRLVRGVFEDGDEGRCECRGGGGEVREVGVGREGAGFEEEERGEGWWGHGGRRGD
jgi:hypothetical protein